MFLIKFWFLTLILQLIENARNCRRMQKFKSNVEMFKTDTIPRHGFAIYIVRTVTFVL